MRAGVHYLGLDLLRFFAAGLVVADHFGAFGWADATARASGDALAFPFLGGMENIGSIGVEIFFLISGLVIAASAKGATPRRFLTNRAIRVLPALWLCGLIAVAARATGEPLGPLLAAFARSATLSPVGPYIDGVVWTLVVEAVFYLLVFVVLLREGFGRIDAVARALGLVSALFLVVMAAAMLGADADPRLAHLAALCQRFPCKVLLLRHGVFFALGMLVWHAFEVGLTRRRLMTLAALALFCSLEIATDHGGLRDVAISLILWWSALGVILASVVAGGAVPAGRRRWAGPVREMGRLSYPLYLNHYVLGMVLVPALAARGLSRGETLGAALLIVGLSSWAIMRYPERAMQRLLRARFERRPDRSATLERAAAT